MIEPCVGERVVVEACVAHAAFADDGVFLGALVAAVKGGSDDGVLLVGRFAFGGRADEVIRGEIRSGGDVVPGHEPEAGNVDGHRVGLPDAALAPRGIVRSAFDHGAAGGVGHLVGEDALGAIDVRDEILLRQVFEGFGPIDGRHLWSKVEHL